MAKVISKELKFGPYKVLGKAIATGGMAQVYKVENADGETFVAKAILPQYLKDRRKKARFLAEFEYLQKISSDIVVKPKEIVDEKGVCCLILEYIDGIELTKIVKKIAPINRGAATHIILELCKALDECHEKGIYHRDIKPENILISKSGEVRLIDLGVVRHVDTKRTLPGTVLGTLDYMAPEQIEGERSDVSNTTDLYALGVILYELLSKKLPIRFTAKDGIIDVYKKKREKLPKPGKLEDLDLETIILELIQADPSDRIQDVLELEGKLLKSTNRRKVKKAYKTFLDRFSDTFYEDKASKKASQKTGQKKPSPKKDVKQIEEQESIPEILVSNPEEHKAFFVMIGFTFILLVLLVVGHFQNWWDLIGIGSGIISKVKSL
ncbi:MAG: serine/threonine protein kinase [Candidatus Cloacimonetes bacterium]|nr:serine/threonine protein kinase [Candidatus Cloacimonadota bacterium]